MRILFLCYCILLIISCKNSNPSSEISIKENEFKVDTAQNWDSINAKRPKQSIIDTVNNLNQFNIIVSSWEEKKNSDFNRYYVVKLKNNTSLKYKSFLFSLTVVFENGNTEEFKATLKKDLFAKGNGIFKVISNEMNNSVQISTDKIRFTILKLEEAIDNEDNMTNLVEQAPITTALTLIK